MSYLCGIYRDLGFSGCKMTLGQARLVHNCFISLDSRDCDNVVMLATAEAGAEGGQTFDCTAEGA